MSDKTIYNCHIHIFTRDHAPRHFLKLLLDDTPLGRFLGLRLRTWVGIALSELSQLSWFAFVLKYVATWLAHATGNDILEREAAILDTGNKKTQAEVLEEIESQYPQGSCFILLPIDMTHADLGELPESIEEQHAKLLAIAAEQRDRLFPFYFADPRRENLVDEVCRNLHADRFRGLKIYPNLGYRPDDPRLLPVYEICQRRNMPVMAHCSIGGVWQYGRTKADRIELGTPHNYKKILREFPGLRICLAHFGGGDEWQRHLEGRRLDVRIEQLDDGTTKTRRRQKSVGETTSRDDDEREPWIKTISDMITSDRYPNLYTDISYTAFAPRFGTLYFDLYDYLKVLLTNQKLSRRVLFGSDFYMVKRERLTEKEVSIALRSRLGEELYFQIANRNPRAYLGLDEAA